MAAEKTASVLIVDDHSSIAFLIGEFVRGLDGFTLAGIAHDSQSALQMMRDQPIDVVLLDIQLPDGNGLQSIAGMLAIAPAAKIMIFSGQAFPANMREAIRLGVSGFVEKTAPLEELERALRQMLSGKVALGPKATMMLGEIVRGDLQEPQLVGRQVEILQLLAAGHSVKEIAARIGLSVPGVYKSIGRMKEKTHSRTAVELMMKARSRGLLGMPEGGVLA
jgi:DNA-binding NarL/FixJ family response regulator